MVTTPSIASDYEAKRQRLTLEKAKVVTLSKQLQIRLQYARLKVEHGWQRQSLNEVENLYFHHSTLKGKSKSLRPSSSTALGPSGGSSSRVTSGHSKDGKAVSESSQVAHPVSVAWSPGAVAAPSSPTVAAFPHDASPLPSFTPVKSPTSRTTKSVSTPSGTPAQAQASESARSVTLSSSVLSAFTQNFTDTQQLSRGTTIDFASLSPFVTATSFSGSSSSITAPSSFVSTVPPSPFSSQTLAYQPSPFAPPPSTSVPPALSLPMSQFASSPYPAAVQPSDMSASLATFPPNPQATFPSLIQTYPSSPSPIPTPPPAPAPTSASTPALMSPPAFAPARSPAPLPSPSPVSKRIHSPAPAATSGPPKKPPPSASTHPHSSASLSFRPSKTFDIPTAPGPVTSTVGTGTQSTTMLTYDSFWSSHSSSAGGWRTATVSNNSRSSGNSRSPATSASVVSGGITPTPASSAAGGGLLGVRGSSAKA